LRGPRTVTAKKRVRLVSNNVMLPEPPDARMDTFKPIASPSEKAAGLPDRVGLNAGVSYSQPNKFSE